MAGLVQDICYFCHEDVPVVTFPCRPRHGCTIKLCPVCIKDFVHRGSQCPICFRRNAARNPNHVPPGYLVLVLVTMMFLVIVRYMAKSSWILVCSCVFAAVIAEIYCESGKWSPDAPFCQTVATMHKFMTVK